MSTVQRVNFEPVTDVNLAHRRDWMLADATLVNPMNALCLVDGEWLTLDSTPGTSQGKAKRATDVTVADALATVIAMPLWAERGRYDIQASAEKKVPVLMLGQYEWNTRIYDASSAAGGAAITTLFQPLRVCTITLALAEGGTRKFSGLVGSSYASNGPVVGYVTKLPSSGQLRFMQGWAVRNGTT